MTSFDPQTMAGGTVHVPTTVSESTPLVPKVVVHLGPHLATHLAMTGADIMAIAGLGAGAVVLGGVLILAGKSGRRAGRID